VNKKTIFLFIIILSIFALFALSFALKKGGQLCPLGQEFPGLAAQAQAAQQKGNLKEAKSLYRRLISEFPNSSQIANWQKKIEEINIQLLFSPAITEESVIYEIKKGDTLESIAKKYNTTAELIMKSNGLRDDKIFPGEKLKVWTQPFSIVVDKSQNTLFLKSHEEIFKTYTVSTGINNSTPVGNFKIINKLANPTWYKDNQVIPPEDPANILGTRWLGIDLTSYGIHGTTDPQNLGKQVTEGCVRLSNADVEELYAIVPVGTEVTIVD